MSVRRVVCHRE